MCDSVTLNLYLRKNVNIFPVLLPLQLLYVAINMIDRLDWIKKYVGNSEMAVSLFSPFREV